MVKCSPGPPLSICQWPLLSGHGVGWGSAWMSDWNWLLGTGWRKWPGWWQHWTERWWHGWWVRGSLCRAETRCSPNTGMEPPSQKAPKRQMGQFTGMLPWQLLLPEPHVLGVLLSGEKKLKHCWWWMWYLTLTESILVSCSAMSCTENSIKPRWSSGLSGFSSSSSASDSSTRLAWPLFMFSVREAKRTSKLTKKGILYQSVEKLWRHISIHRADS